MPPVTRENSGLVPHLVTGRDPDPHFPVECVAQIVPEAAQFRIDAAANDRRGALDTLSPGDPLEPVAQDAGSPAFAMRVASGEARIVDVVVAAERHTHCRFGAALQQ